MCLYDWQRLAVKCKIPRKKKKGKEDGQHTGSDEDDPQEQETVNFLNTSEDTNIEPEVMMDVDDTPPNTQITLVDDDDLSSTLVDSDESYQELESDYTTGDDESDYSDSDSDDEPKAKRKSMTHLYFLSQHPHHDTHFVRLNAEKNAMIPCFVGGILPRRDKGNQEDYALTMLTIFKPWRDGRDLKDTDDSWENAMLSHKFSDRQIEIMDFFHIRYECNDARDDFSARRREEKESIKASNPIFSQFRADFEGVAIDEEALQALNSNLATCFNEEMMDSATVKKQLKALEMEMLLQSSRWSEPHKASSYNDSGEPLFEDFVTGEGRTALEWKKTLDDKRNKVLEQKRTQGQNVVAEKEKQRRLTRYEVDEVKVLDKDYLTRSFKPKTMEDGIVLDEFVKRYTLNEEQERAFRIIGNHAIAEYKEQLKMYIGGMGGTGKSQVIKALRDYFKAQGKDYAFMMLAPTGSAAALIGGSTYHSVLAFQGPQGSSKGEGGGGSHANTSAKSLEEIRLAIQNVDYIFLDEVSMVDCGSLCSIGMQMNLAMRVEDIAFGGKHMIFAGDFAQLPPVSMQGQSLYNSTVMKSLIHTTKAVNKQRQALGHLLWHQVDVVVILRKNMQQASQSPEDAAFRQLLVNLCMRACTPDDIALLQSRVPGPHNPHVDLMKDMFQNKSIITCRNANRDKINIIGSKKFASDNGKVLEPFVSIDRLSSQGTKRPGKQKEPLDPQRTTDQIDPKVQDMLHDLPHSDTDHLAGKLYLCLGLPVMVKRNQATELSVTNGAEGTVVGWQSHTLADGRKTLQTVFVHLTQPPASVHINRLPPNVVPVSQITDKVWVKLPNGTTMHLTRTQVPILPSFAMTDFCSQGRTREINIIDLMDCPTHQSVYTCLSRGSSLQGTVVLRMCMMEKLVGGLSGYLRQEFQELEILDEITRRKFEGSLDPSVSGNIRNVMVAQYRKVYGKYKLPDHVHPGVVCVTV